jgi:(p)ppGpp synthase/HD superfamily hydrolase
LAENEIQISKRFFRAAEWAAARHEARQRTARTTPSLGQVLGIASLVIEDGGSEREAIAAMILDALGDGELPISELRQEFGKKVAKLVARSLADRPAAGVDPSELDAAAWKERRERYLDGLDLDDDERVGRLAAADTLREVRTLIGDLRRHGSIAFARFATPPNDQLEWYRSLLAVFTRRMARGHLVQELRTSITEMERLVELDTATAAWRVAHVDAA